MHVYHSYHDCVCLHVHVLACDVQLFGHFNSIFSSSMHGYSDQSYINLELKFVMLAQGAWSIHLDIMHVTECRY